MALEVIKLTKVVSMILAIIVSSIKTAKNHLAK